MYWPMERELLAVIAELLHSLVRITHKAHGGKGTPKPLRIPRPDAPMFSDTHVATASPAGAVMSAGQYFSAVRE